MSKDLEIHYPIIARRLEQSRVVPLLGAGVNRCGREEAWQPRQTLPDGKELATYLAGYLPSYPEADDTDLLRVSQYYSVLVGSGALYDELHEVFDGDYSPTPMHTFLARLPSILRARERLGQYQLIVTTNYDDALEQAFQAEDEPFDLLVYAAEGEHRGRFMHHSPDGATQPVQPANEYRGVSLDTRTVIMKMHGAVNRSDKLSDSYVIAEDDYVDYLAHSDLAKLVPATIAEKLRTSHFLFLGYSLRDWNLRVILHRIWGKQQLTYKSWAIQLTPEAIDEMLWKTRGVEILRVDLKEYASELSRLLGGMVPAQERN